MRFIRIVIRVRFAGKFRVSFQYFLKVIGNNYFDGIFISMDLCLQKSLPLVDSQSI